MQTPREGGERGIVLGPFMLRFKGCRASLATRWSKGGSLNRKFVHPRLRKRIEMLMGASSTFFIYRKPWSRINFNVDSILKKCSCYWIRIFIRGYEREEKVGGIHLSSPDTTRWKFRQGKKRISRYGEPSLSLVGYLAKEACKIKKKKGYIWKPATATMSRRNKWRNVYTIVSRLNRGTKREEKRRKKKEEDSAECDGRNFLISSQNRAGVGWK